MGIYQFNCSRCGETVEWFSGRADQLCGDCYEKANAEASMLQAGAIDVLEENEPAAPFKVKDTRTAPVKVNVNVPAQYDRPMTFGEWARNVRTLKLMEINKRLSQRVREAEEERDTARDRANGWWEKMREANDEIRKLRHDIERHLAITTQLTNEVSKLESDARSDASILEIYIKHADRRLKRIDELTEKLAKIDEVLHP